MSFIISSMVVLTFSLAYWFRRKTEALAFGGQQAQCFVVLEIGSVEAESDAANRIIGKFAQRDRSFDDLLYRRQCERWIS